MSEITILPSAGPIPGIPGDHAPGIYEIDYGERTIKIAATNILKPDKEETLPENVEKKPPKDKADK